MNDPLAIYLHDHLAGADIAIDLLQAIKNREKDEALCDLVTHTLAEVQQDRETLQHLTDKGWFRIEHLERGHGLAR